MLVRVRDHPCDPYQVSTSTTPGGMYKCHRQKYDADVAQHSQLLAKSLPPRSIFQTNKQNQDKTTILSIVVSSNDAWPRGSISDNLFWMCTANRKEGPRYSVSVSTMICTVPCDEAQSSVLAPIWLVGPTRQLGGPLLLAKASPYHCLLQVTSPHLSYHLLPLPTPLNRILPIQSRRLNTQCYLCCHQEYNHTLEEGETCERPRPLACERCLTTRNLFKASFGASGDANEGRWSLMA